MKGARARVDGTMGRIVGRNQPHLVEPECRLRGVACVEMTEMNGVEGSTEHAEPATTAHRSFARRVFGEACRAAEIRSTLSSSGGSSRTGSARTAAIWRHIAS